MVFTKKNSVPIESLKKLSINGVNAPWYDLRTVTSTMDVALELVQDGCSPWTVITARNQLSGRGTHGREWSSPTGKGLWLSVIIPSPEHLFDLDGLTVLAAEVMTEVLGSLTGCKFAVKRPNDVVIEGRKIAGILVESVTSADRVQSVILGIGLNFYQTSEDFIREGLTEATSLFIETSSVPDCEIFLISYLEHLKRFYKSFMLEKGNDESFNRRT